jgi:hypothetical protein
MRPREFDTHPVSFADAMSRGLWRGIGKGAHDGDTIIAFVDKGMFDYQMVTLRLIMADGTPINAPEIVGTSGEVLLRAQQAQEFAERQTLGRPLLFRTVMAKTGSERMSFDRYIANVSVFNPLDRSEQDLGGLLHQAGLVDIMHPAGVMETVDRFTHRSNFHPHDVITEIAAQAVIESMKPVKRKRAPKKGTFRKK